MKRVFFPLVAAGLLASCNQHPVSYVDALAVVEFQQPSPVDPTVKLDMLWVIDNSGSMCQEQAVLRQNFDRMVDTLEETGTDFQLGVTTTHMQEDSPIEPVARPGFLQSTPQPVVGFDDSCYEAVDEKGETIAGDFTPVRQLIDVAVDCMDTPDESYRAVTDDEIRCALGLADSTTCEVSGRCTAGTCQHEDLFPPADSYRSLPKVLRSEDYRSDDGVLDVARLKADFACMSTVGVRGSGFEKGLGAAVLAVDPAMTGGAVGSEGADTSAPNHGLIRHDARLAVLFVTDENDCTHDGRLAERSQCGGDICEYWNHPELEEISPLIPPTELRDRLLENVKATKGTETLAPDDVVAVSIHGNSSRYDGGVVAGPECHATASSELPSECGTFDLCKDEEYEALPPTCATALGSAYSGDRYSRFLKSFGEGNYFPEANPQSPEDPLFGWMCTGNFRPALVSAAELIRKVPSGCITRRIVTCAGEGAACPDHPYSGEAGTCTPRPNSDEYFCDSYLQIRVESPDAAVLQDLATNGFCYPDSISGDGACVVNRSNYELGACSGEVSGVKIDWTNLDEARQRLAGTTVELRYTGYAAEE